MTDYDSAKTNKNFRLFDRKPMDGEYIIKDTMSGGKFNCGLND